MASSLTAIALPPEARTARRIEKPDRSRDAYARGNRACVDPRLGAFLATLEGANDRRTPGGLYRVHAGTPGADPAQALEFLERLPHADQSRAATRRIEDCIRQFPVKLFGELESHRLLAFDAIRLLQRGEIEPARLTYAFRDQLAAVVDQPIDEVNSRALQRDLRDIHFGCVGGAIGGDFHASTAAICGKRCARVAIGRNRDFPYAQLLRHAHCHRQAASLERARR
jgi:hypothetical protein